MQYQATVVCHNCLSFRWAMVSPGLDRLMNLKIQDSQPAEVSFSGAPGWTATLNRGKAYFLCPSCKEP